MMTLLVVRSKRRQLSRSIVQSLFQGTVSTLIFIAKHYDIEAVGYNAEGVSGKNERS